MKFAYKWIVPAIFICAGLKFSITGVSSKSSIGLGATSYVEGIGIRITGVMLLIFAVYYIYLGWKNDQKK